MYQNKEGRRPIISVIICTYNRANYLDKCLDSLIDQATTNFEVIVVNGPSTDNTEKILKRYPFKVIQQNEKGGLSAARNIGIKEAKGEIIAFIDDDGIADKNWLNELSRRYTTADIVSVGGKIIPTWLSERPEWYIDRLGGYLSLLDFSQNSEQMVFPEHPYGCNMSFRKEIFKELGCFDVSFGRGLSKHLLSQEELDLYKRIDDKRYKTMYSPKAIVYHQIDASRLTREWFKRRSYWGSGVSTAIFHKKHYGTSYVFKFTMKALFLGIPYNLVRYSYQKIMGDDKSSIWELSLLSKLGYVKESLGLNHGAR
jgi:glycosyltransferase involved in cell wall biosynthesis